MNTNLTQFHFESLPVRVITDESGEPWFVLSDVCVVLEIGNPSDAARRLDDDEVTLSTIEGSHRPTNIINESGLYSLILTSRKPQAKRFKKWVTAEVLPSIRKTGGYQSRPEPMPIPPFPSGSCTDATVSLGALADSLNLHGTARVNIYRRATKEIHPALAAAMDAIDYAVDAPIVAGQSVSDSSYRTASATSLLKEHDLHVTAREFNHAAEAAGILQRLSRQGSREVKYYWNITEDGLRYGKNIVSPANPRETQPHWYADTFLQLIDELGLEA